MRVKAFESRNLSYLENEINRYLATLDGKKVKNIQVQYQTYVLGGNSYYSAMVSWE